MHAKRRQRVNRVTLDDMKPPARQEVPQRLWTHHKCETTRLQRAAQGRDRSIYFMRVVETGKWNPAIDPFVTSMIGRIPVDHGRHQSDMRQSMQAVRLHSGAPQELRLFVGQCGASVEYAVLCAGRERCE